MAKQNHSKKALFGSVLAIVLCLAMLIGTTFAWFTDSASTNVSNIESGKLDIVLQMWNGNEWVLAEGETLAWQKAAEAPDTEEVLWEPGCTYRLPELRVVNNGNLALKYKLVITGIDGDIGLLSVIDFTYGDGINIDDEVILAPGGMNEGIIIEGHMREDAGNTYQGQTLDGITITAMATQAAYESDSYDDQYDADAEYLVPPVTEVTYDGIEFYVLKTEGTKLLLLAKDTLEHTMQFDSDTTSCAWEDSDARAYLNNEWLPSCPELSEIAVETTLYTHTNSCTNENPVFIETIDKVFLLSEADVFGTASCDRYVEGFQMGVANDPRFYTTGEMLTPPAEGWMLGDGSGDDDSNAWWLRTPWGQAYMGHVNNCDWTVEFDWPFLPLLGAADGNQVPPLGLRPALWVDIG